MQWCMHRKLMFGIVFYFFVCLVYCVFGCQWMGTTTPCPQRQLLQKKKNNRKKACSCCVFKSNHVALKSKRIKRVVFMFITINKSLCLRLRQSQFTNVHMYRDARSREYELLYVNFVFADLWEFVQTLLLWWKKQWQHIREIEQIEYYVFSIKTINLSTQ